MRREDGGYLGRSAGQPTPGRRSPGHVALPAVGPGRSRPHCGCVPPSRRSPATVRLHLHPIRHAHRRGGRPHRRAGPGGSGLDATFLIMLLPLTVAGLLLVLRARSTYPATSPARQWVLGSPVATEAKMTPRCKTAPAVDSARATPPSAAASRTPIEVTGFKAGDLVVAPFVWSDGTYESCCEGLQTFLPTRRHVGPRRYRRGQGEAVRVPQAQDTVVELPVGADSALLPSLLSLSDVFATGHHCADTPGSTRAPRSP